MKTKVGCNCGECIFCITKVGCNCGKCVFCRTNGLKCPNCQSPKVEPYFHFYFGYKDDGEGGIRFDLVNRTLSTICSDCMEWFQIACEFDPPSGTIWDVLKIPMGRWTMGDCMDSTFLIKRALRLSKEVASMVKGSDEE